MILLPPRDWLRRRIADRFAAMIEDGALDEVRTLLARGLDPDLPVMRAIGVRELAEHLAGRTDLATAIDTAVTASRQYAKRQQTWFSRQPPPDWPRFTDIPTPTNMERLAIKLHEQALTG